MNENISLRATIVNVKPGAKISIRGMRRKHIKAYRQGEKISFFGVACIGLEFGEFEQEKRNYFVGVAIAFQRFRNSGSP